MTDHQKMNAILESLTVSSDLRFCFVTERGSFSVYFDNYNSEFVLNEEYIFGTAQDLIDAHLTGVRVDSVSVVDHCRSPRSVL